MGDGVIDIISIKLTANVGLMHSKDEEKSIEETFDDLSWQ